MQKTYCVYTDYYTFCGGIPMDVKDYIQRVYTLEKACFEQQALVNQLKEQLDQAKKPKLYAVKEVTYSKSGNTLAGFGSLVLFAVIGALIGLGLLLVFMVFCLIAELLDPFVDSAFISFFSEMEGSPLFSLFIIIGALLGFAFGIYSAIAYSEGNKNAYEQALEKNREAVENNAQIADLAKRRVSFLQIQLNQAIDLNNQTLLLLKNFYNMGVVYPKYRSLVPISMFHEYLSSGRCSQLEGHEGAYNIYEMEIRMNVIISKLDEIIDRLDAIQNNQYMLYHAIQESNRTAKQVCNTLVDCSNHLQNISANTEASMYFQQATALNATYIAWFKDNK